MSEFEETVGRWQEPYEDILSREAVHSDTASEPGPHALAVLATKQQGCPQVAPRVCLSNSSLSESPPRIIQQKKKLWRNYFTNIDKPKVLKTA